MSPLDRLRWMQFLWIWQQAGFYYWHDTVARPVRERGLTTGPRKFALTGQQQIESGAVEDSGAGDRDEAGEQSPRPASSRVRVLATEGAA